MREATFNFTPVANFQVAKVVDDYININTKTGRMNFATSYVTRRGLEKQWVKFYWDEKKKALAWKKITDVQLTEWKGALQMETKNRRGGHIGFSLSVKKILKQIAFTQSLKLKKLEIKTLKKAVFGEDVDYIILKDQSDLSMDNLDEETNDEE